MDVSWLITAILGAVVMYCIYYYLSTKNYYYWKNRGVASIHTLPLLGAMYKVILQIIGPGQLFCEIYSKFEGERFGGYFQFNSPILMIRDPELIQQMFIKDFIHFEDRTRNMKNPNDPNDLFCSGMGNLTGDEWRNARHKLTPTFTSGKLKMMFHSISECSDNVILHLKDNLDQDVNTRDLGLKFVINVIANVAFGLNIDTLRNDKDSDFFKVSAKFFQPSPLSLMKIIIAMWTPGIRNFFNVKVTDVCVEKFFRKLTRDIIQYRESTGTRRNDFLQIMLDQRAKESKQCNTEVNTNATTKSEEFEEPEDKELMDQLRNTPSGSGKKISASELFTDEFITSQAFIFISGGSETTAAVLSFILHELAIHVDLQKRVQKEIDDILSTNVFSYQAVKKMTYLEQFMNETFRLYPVATGLIRVCTRDYKIPGSDVIVKKDELILIPVIALHKDPQYFPDPEKFDPDRFENPDTIPKGVYYNFGIGPRICIAMRLAMLEMKVLLAKLLMNYNIILSEKTTLPIQFMKTAFVLNVEGGLWVKFENRQS